LVKILDRKKEHLQIANDKAVRFQELTTGFENFHFIHNALPEIDLENVDTRIKFLGFELQSPLMISAISGGEEFGLELNKDLASVANRAGIAFSLGSIRPVLEHPKCIASYQIARKVAPDIPIIANIGGAQLVKSYKSQDLIRILEKIDVNAISVHLNPLQEALQPEGEPHFSGVSKAIEIMRETLPYPVIVKEVGFGLSGDVVRRLLKMGIQWVEVAGSGGTSWSRIEYHRIKEKEKKDIAAQFFEWGIRTTDSLKDALKMKNLNVIASGGIDNGLKFAKAIALGARLAGVAESFLRVRNESGPEGLLRLINVFNETLRIAMFCTGCRNLNEFRGNKSIISCRKNQ